jgi:hypothetical protein
MGGRTQPDGTIAITDYDHNEADTLGNAVLTAPNPLAGYIALAQQLAGLGITEVTGDVIIDDRLFQPYNFRDEFDLRPIFVNDDVVDLTINPTAPGNDASVVWRPVSAALGVKSTLVTGASGSDYTLQLKPQFPQCIGQLGCTAEVKGQLPIDFSPPLTNKFPLIQTFRIVQPSNYARTVFIEALEAAGVTVDAAPVKENPTHLLPPKRFYPPDTKLAELEGLPYSENAKLILNPHCPDKAAILSALATIPGKNSGSCGGPGETHIADPTGEADRGALPNGLTRPENLAALVDLLGQWIDTVHKRRSSRIVMLDMDSRDSPTYGEQQGSAYNGRSLPRTPTPRNGGIITHLAVT